MMLGKGDINPWFPERDTVIHQALGKLAEECSKLAKIAVRCMIQGIDESDPGTTMPNRQELMKEIADVQAAITWLSGLVTLPPGMSARGRAKLEGFRRWQQLIEAASK
jgi:hypothetical protein